MLVSSGGTNGDSGPTQVARLLTLHMPTAANIWTSYRENLRKIVCMSDTPSAELLTRYYRCRDEAAAQELFRRYAARLTALARSRLSPALAPRVDAEDVVQSAYRSFFLLAGEGDVLLQESGDLWRLLVRITLRKVYRSARRHHADCRSVEREHFRPDETEVIAVGREPTPAEAAALVDELRGVLAPLDSVQRRVVELRLQGHEVEAIAAEVGRSTRTVRRVLAAVGAELERRLSDGVAPREEGLLAYSDVVLLRQLGQGGMGKVYRATWRGSAVPVAVKLLRKPLRRHATTATRFREEAALLARLRHPGIVAVHGIGHLPDGGHFLVMDLIEGSDLGRQPRPSVLGGDGHVRVSDFGLARALTGGEGPQGGTAGFMAPEQFDSQGTISARTDVFGLGAVLCALLPERSPEVDGLCRCCLAPDPEGRFASAAELVSALNALLAGLPPPAGCVGNLTGS
jgi:RNA polymerase sigma factor (sigma-70 family)